MPRIPDQLLRSVTYLFVNEEDARERRGAGGTGFFVDLRSAASGRTYRYAVSNRHVVFNGATTLRINTDNGDAETLSLPESIWVGHPDHDDVAVAPVALEMPAHWAVCGLAWSELIPTPERMAQLNIGPGDDVFILGRFAAHTGRQRNQPLARFGNIAMMPGEPVEAGSGYLVDAFLVEMRSLPGFSGSPVFIHVGSGSLRGNGTMTPFLSESIGLLGIDTGHKVLSTHVTDRTSGKPVNPDWKVDQNSGVAIVAPYTKIVDVIEGPIFTNQRAEADKFFLRSMLEQLGSISRTE